MYGAMNPSVIMKNTENAFFHYQDTAKPYYCQTFVNVKYHIIKGLSIILSAVQNIFDKRLTF